MKIKDLRKNSENHNFTKRNTQDICNILIHHSHDSSDKNIFYHYSISSGGTIEYANDIEYNLGNINCIDLCLVGNFEEQKPSSEQLQAAAELISYLLIPRDSTPDLNSTSQVISHFAKNPDTTCPGKTWPSWKGYLLGTKAVSQPNFLAEFEKQKVILPKDGTITFKVTFKNTGNQVWCNSGENHTKLNVCWEGNTSSAKLWKTYKIPQGSSIFKHSSWVDDFCASSMQEENVAPGETASFLLTLSGNNIKPGNYVEDFGLAKGKEWINNLVNGSPAGKAHCWFEIEVV